MGKNKQEIENEKEEKPYSKFQWFLIAVIPIVFTIFMVLIVMSFAGINVFQWAKNVGNQIPVVSDFIGDEKEETASETEYEKKIVDLEGEIKDSEAQIQKLESIIDSRDKEIQNVDIEKQRLEEEIRELKAVQNDNKRAFKDIINTYETMTPKKAAPIITALEDDEAVRILSSLKSDTLAAILEKMDPKVAASLTQKLTVESEKNNNQDSETDS